MAAIPPLKVLTFNCWGLKYGSKHRQERINAIALALTASAYDVIALQGIRVLSDFELIRTQLSGRVPHAKFFYSGVSGSGLAFFSRYPIEHAYTHPYILSGRPFDIGVSDWYNGKAAASMVIKHPILEEIEIFNTQLCTDDTHKLVNAWELAKLIKMSATLGRYLGDLGSLPESLHLRTIKEHTGIIDSWEAIHGSARRASRKIDPHSAILYSGVTVDSPQNTFTKAHKLDDNALLEFGKRFDYVLFRGPIGQSYRYKLKCTHARVVFTEPVPDRPFSYSKHFGVEATLTISPPHVSTPDLETSLEYTGVPSTQIARQLLECRDEASKTAKLEVWTAYLCLFIVVGLCASAAWLPRHWLHPIYTLLSASFAVLGITMFLSGSLFGRWEYRALTSVIEELEHYRRDGTTVWADDTRWQQKTVV